MNNPKTKGIVSKKNGEGKLFVANGFELVSDTEENLPDEEMQETLRDSVGGGIAGFIFMKTRSLDNKPFPLKLNSRKLNNEEVTAIMDVLMSYVAGKTPNQTFSGKSDISGIKNKGILDLLIYSGKDTIDKEYPFWIDLKSKGSTITFGKDKKTIPLKALANEANQKELVGYLKTMWRATNAKHLNQKMNKFEGVDGKFTWFGVEIDPSKQNYNDFQFAQEALSTNATFPSGRLFIQPTVTFKDSKRWNKIPNKSKKQTKADAVLDTMNRVDSLQKVSKKSKLDTIPSPVLS